MSNSISRRTFAGLVLAAGLSVSAAMPAALAAEYSKDHPLKVALVLHGNLGDKSFFDSASGRHGEGQGRAAGRREDHRGRLRPRPAGSRRSPTPPTAATTSSSPARST